MKTIKIKLEDKDYKTLEKMAKNRNITMNDLIIEIIKEYLKRNKDGHKRD